MKFKALIESEGVASNGQLMVLHVLQALQRLERASDKKPAERRGVPATLVVKLSPDSFAFCHRGGADEGSQTWSHFQIARLFREYRIESKRNNEIALEAPIANLVHVFSSCASSDRTTLRLANGRDGRPILGFGFSLTGNVADHHVEQEVPVRVIAEQEAETIREPDLPEPEYQVELPPSLQRLRNVLDKMRAVTAQHVMLEATQERLASGNSSSAKVSLRMVAEAELVTIASTFPSLALVMEGKKNESPDRTVRLFLSLRRLAEVLAAFQQVAAEAHIVCVLEDRALVLYALLPQSMGSLISYVPVVTL